MSQTWDHGLHHVYGAKMGGWGASYTYTANGELLTKTVGADVTTYEYDVFGPL